MIRDPLLPVRLVHGVWISADPAVASPIKDDPFTPTPPRTDADPFPPTWRPLLCFPDPVVFSDVVLPPRPATDYARAFAEYDPPPALRRIFAAVALDGSGVWAIGDSVEEARAGAVDRRDYFRDCARSVDDDFPPLETDAAWLDTLALVTLSGTTGSLRAIVKALDDVIPWCPADLWDNPEPVKEP